MHIKEYLNRSPLCKWSIAIDEYFWLSLFPCTSFYRRGKISFHGGSLFVLRRDLCFSMIYASLSPSVAHYRRVNQVQSAGIRLVRAWLGIYMYINRSINNFKATLKTFYHHSNDLPIHVKNTYQMYCFLHECLAFFLKQDGVNFGNDRASKAFYC